MVPITQSASFADAARHGQGRSQRPKWLVRQWRLDRIRSYVVGRQVRGRNRASSNVGGVRHSTLGRLRPGSRGLCVGRHARRDSGVDICDATSCRVLVIYRSQVYLHILRDHSRPL